MVKPVNILIVVLFAVIAVGIYKIQFSSKESISAKASTEKSAVQVRAEEDKAILKTVTSYQNGYRTGCDIAMQKIRSVDMTQEQRSDHPYLLGLERGERVCRAEIKRKKSLRESGYKDGCKSAKSKMTKNKKFYKTSKSYRKSWDEGFRKCKRKPKQTIKREPEKQKRSSRTTLSRSSYEQGYKDGCSTTNRRYKRNREKYNSDSNYRRGWHSGERECRGEPNRNYISPMIERREAPYIYIPGY